MNNNISENEKKQLFVRFINKKATPEQIQEVKRLVATNKEDRALLKRAKTLHNDRLFLENYVRAEATKSFNWYLLQPSFRYRIKHHPNFGNLYTDVKARYEDTLRVKRVLLGKANAEEQALLEKELQDILSIPKEHRHKSQSRLLSLYTQYSSLYQSLHITEELPVSWSEYLKDFLLSIKEVLYYPHEQTKFVMMILCVLLSIRPERTVKPDAKEAMASVRDSMNKTAKIVSDGEKALHKRFQNLEPKGVDSKAKYTTIEPIVKPELAPVIVETPKQPADSLHTLKSNINDAHIKEEIEKRKIEFRENAAESNEPALDSVKREGLKNRRDELSHEINSLISSLSLSKMEKELYREKTMQEIANIIAHPGDIIFDTPGAKEASARGGQSNSPKKRQSNFLESKYSPYVENGILIIPSSFIDNIVAVKGLFQIGEIKFYINNTNEALPEKCIEKTSKEFQISLDKIQYRNEIIFLRIVGKSSQTEKTGETMLYYNNNIRYPQILALTTPLSNIRFIDGTEN